MTRVSPHLIYQLISPLSWEMLICHNTLLDRLWLEVIWSPPTELAEGTRCREVAPDTKLRASSFEMNLETSSSFISIFEGIQFYWAKFAMYFSDPSGINNRSSIFLFILPQKKIFPPNNFLVFFSSFFFPLMDQIFSKWRGQKMEKFSWLLALGIILTALSCKWPNMICLSVIAICRQTLISPISTISQIRSMSTFILRAKMKLFQYVKHIMCIDS